MQINLRRKISIEKSKSIAAIIGPTLVVMVVSEMKAWNPTLYDSQIVPLVYVSGVLFFVGGISIVRNHNFLVFGWQIFVTLTGWFCIFIGLVRMFFPQVYLMKFHNDISALIAEILLTLLGFFLSLKAYWPQEKTDKT